MPGPEAFASIRYLEVSLLDPPPSSRHGAYWCYEFRQRSLATLLELLLACPNLAELKLLNVESFTEIFNPLKKMTKACFGRYHSLVNLTIVCRDLADWGQ